MTSETRAPVETLEDLDSLDPLEMVEGYRDGYGDEPEPGGNRSRSYWHGWRNGAVDGGHREKDGSQALLAARVVEQQRQEGQTNDQ